MTSSPARLPGASPEDRQERLALRPAGVAGGPAARGCQSPNQTVASGSRRGGAGTASLGRRGLTSEGMRPMIPAARSGSHSGLRLHSPPRMEVHDAIRPGPPGIRAARGSRTLGPIATLTGRPEDGRRPVETAIPRRGPLSPRRSLGDLERGRRLDGLVVPRDDREHSARLGRVRAPGLRGPRAEGLPPGVVLRAGTWRPSAATARADRHRQSGRRKGSYRPISWIVSRLDRFMAPSPPSRTGRSYRGP
jgi:hypothetical protein